METYLGHTVKYWLELERRAEKLDVTDWIEEVAGLRAKVSFYESRLDQIDTFRKNQFKN